ncbi:MAG: DUF29 domain-containing protein [Phycisphaerae bacterium]|nr:DUF29 domain-containing protein [Phycisphaerae bacterium]
MDNDTALREIFSVVQGLPAQAVSEVWLFVVLLQSRLQRQQEIDGRAGEGNTARSTRYGDDLYAWSHEQASLLSAQRFAELDFPNLIDEVESFGKQEQASLGDALTGLIRELVLWQQFPGLQSEHKKYAANRARDDLQCLLEDSPSLQPWLAGELGECYWSARNRVLIDTGLPEQHIPEVCPWTYAEVTDGDFWPSVA